jgi:hypothetical protein
MDTLSFIAFMDARTAAAGRIASARTDDPDQRASRRRTTRPSRS